MSSSRRVTVRRLLSCQATTARRTGERNVQIGIGLPNPVLEVPGQLPVAWARRAEERGFSSLATIDRIAYPSYDSLTVLAAAAAVTERIGLVTNILLGPAYTPVLLAKVTASIDQLSGGRFTLGARGGWPARRLPGGRPVLRRPGPAVRRRPGAAAPGLGGRAGGRQPVPGGPADHPGPHPAADRRAAAAGRRRGRPAGTPASPSGAPRRRWPPAPSVRSRKGWEQAGGTGQPRVLALAYFSLGEEHTAESLHNLRSYYGFLGDWAERDRRRRVPHPGGGQGDGRRLRGAGRGRADLRPHRGRPGPGRPARRRGPGGSMTDGAGTATASGGSTTCARCS